jgi:DNA helicase HerA-like ATPase
VDEAPLGVIIRGSLSKGLELKLDPSVPPESLRAGMFAIAGGGSYDFFSLITDLELCAATPEALQAPVPEPNSLLRSVLEGDTIYTKATLRPHLMVDRAALDPSKALQPVKTIPAHFTAVRKATPEDVHRVFGDENSDGGKHFRIGTPLDMDEIPVCLNLDAFAERSNAIFGKSGTGKTFLTRMVLCGLIQKETAVNLVFDMHGEYGWRGTDESRPGGSTKGLRELYPDRVQVFALDPRPWSKQDREIRIPYSLLEPEDVLSLQKVIQLTPTAAENSYLLERRFGKDWFAQALALSPEKIEELDGQVHTGAMQALCRKLIRLEQACRGFLKPDRDCLEDAVDLIIRNLEQGIHTVIDFGRYSQLVHYILVANILTRRIDARWRDKTEQYLSNPKQHPQPRRVVITIEEAHKFLEPGIAEQTTFGRIARELRKYNVTLLVVDQRPSQIEREVLSQIGTKICCLLDDDADVDAALSGTSGASALRSVLASLDTRQQALVFGHALPMPVVLKTRDYDEAFWKSAGYRDPETRKAQAAKDRQALWE